MKSHTISIVIPTLNEACGIRECLATVAPLAVSGAEVIVCDGGSDDATRELAAGAGALVVESERGRARQMNAGAARASGRLLAFLHADTRASPAVCRRLLEQSREPRPAWGRFDVRLAGPEWPLRMIETSMNWRSRLTGIATGDQLIFVHRELFGAVGGFPDLALMEDVAISSRLRRRMRPVCCRERVVTSARKWRREGVLRTMLLMWRLRLAFALGADPARLVRSYYRPENGEGR